MSYPYYYPYFSARTAYQTPLLEADLAGIPPLELREEQVEIELAVRRRQQLINQQRIYRYQEELKSKQRALELLDQAEIQNKLLINMQEQNHQRRLAQLKHEGYLRNIDHLQKEGFNLNRGKSIQQDVKNMLKKDSEDAENERKIQQYQQELLEKIQKSSSHKKQTQNTSSLSAQVGKKYNNVKNKKGTKLSFVESQVQGDDNIIVNQRSHKQVNGKDGKNKYHNKKIIRYQSLKKPAYPQNINLEDYQTIDVDSLKHKSHLWMNQSTKKKQNYSIYQSEKKYSQKHKRPKSSLPGQSILQRHKRTSIVQNQKKKHSFVSADNLSFPEEALKKIQNRLKLSEIVYKDSKWRHEKHQTEHLLNTFELQVKGRKQIKDNINNHPRILKKHALVVSSR